MSIVVFHLCRVTQIAFMKDAITNMKQNLMILYETRTAL